MNRRERRAAKRQRGKFALIIDHGLLSERDKNYGLPVNCYACGVGHAAAHAARIQDSRELSPTVSHCARRVMTRRRRTI